MRLFLYLKLTKRSFVSSENEQGGWGGGTDGGECCQSFYAGVKDIGPTEESL